jgi:hypothetical protein
MTTNQCRDGLITVPSIDGPVQTACLAPCCRETREAARARRAAVLADRDPFARIPQTDDEEIF